MTGTKDHPKKTTDRGAVRTIAIRACCVAAGLSALFTIMSLLLWGRHKAISVAAGGAISIVSFAVLVVAISYSFGHRGWSVFFVSLVGIAKLLLIGAVLWWLIVRVHIDPIAFLAGFSTMVATLLVEGTLVKRV